MKDENLNILMQTILEDVVSIRQTLAAKGNTVSSGEKDKDQLSLINKELEAIRHQLGSISAQKENSIDQQRLIDLKLQIDRVSARMSREDSFWRYYFYPGVLARTIGFILLLLTLGAVGDRLLVKYEMKKLNSERYELIQK